MAGLDIDLDALPVSWMTRGRLRGLLCERDDARIRAEQAEREATRLRAAEPRPLAPGAPTDPPKRSEEAERMQHVLTTLWDLGDTPRGLADALVEDGYLIVRDGGER